jgi:hypothetical protein
MKFLKPDGTVEDGEPLTEEQAALREEMERYLHIAVCKNAYHATYDVTPCRNAANFLTLQTAGAAAGITAEKIKAAVEALFPRPRSRVQPSIPEPVISVVDAIGPDDDAEKTIAIAADQDLF